MLTPLFCSNVEGRSGSGSALLIAAAELRACNSDCEDNTTCKHYCGVYYDMQVEGILA